MQIKTFIFNPIQVNTYVLYNPESQKCAIIDAGCLGEAEENELAKFIDENGLRVEYLLNTHLHLDHQFGNAFVAERYGVKPLAAEADEPLTRTVRHYAAAFGLNDDLVKEQALGGYLQDKDVINICGEECHIIATPGHTPGGICFYFPKLKLVFTGDTLFAGGIGRADLPGGNYGSLIRSIQRGLLTLPDDTLIYCGHGPSSSIGIEKQTNPYL